MVEMNTSAERVYLDFAKLDGPARYKLLISAIVPRPIAFVSTVNAAGVGNLAPFSFFNGVSSDPACLVISITPKNGPDGAAAKKDTLRNIEETGQFVVNTVSAPMTEAVNQCSALYPYGVDEMREVGLTPLPSTLVRPARVAESPVQMECELYRKLEIGDGRVGSATLIVGRILAMHVLAEAYEKGRLKIEALQPVARLGGLSYGLTAGAFDLPRPKLET